MNEDYDLTEANGTGFSRTFLEVTLVMILVFMATYSPGKNSGTPDSLQISSQKQATGQNVDLESSAILVTPEGFKMEGQIMSRDQIIGYLENEGMKHPLVMIDPGNSIHENLRWLLDIAAKTHDLKLVL